MLGKNWAIDVEIYRRNLCPARNADEKALAPTLLRGLSGSGAVMRALFGFSGAAVEFAAEAIGATTAVAAADDFFGGAVIGTRFLGITGAVGLAGSAAAAAAFGLAGTIAAFVFCAPSDAFDAAVVVRFALVGLGACRGGFTCRKVQFLSDFVGRTKLDKIVQKRKRNRKDFVG